VQLPKPNLWVETTVQDLRYALRTLRNSPSFAIAAVCTLALGIGANTAIFSVVSGVMLRPLPFADPDRLVQLNQTIPPGTLGLVPYPDLEELRKQSTSFEAMVAYSTTSRNLQGVDEPELVPTVAAERGLFQMLGVAPVFGRTFHDDDPLNVAVASAGFWRRHFGAEWPAQGRNITLDGESFTVIGVMPEAFQFPYRASRTEIWIPWEAPLQYRNSRNYRPEFVAARLKQGVNLEAARSEVSVIARRQEAQFPDTNKGRGVRIRPLSEVIAGQVRGSLLVLLGAVGLVLLVACANVANLLLARAAMRSREVAIRAALGAGHLRLVRQFLTESLLLAIGGGLAGLALGRWGAGLLLKLAATQIPRASEIGFDWRVFTYLTAMCIVTGIGFGLAPAIATARADAGNGLVRSSTRAGSATKRLRDGLVVAEVAMAFMLLIGAGLLLRAFFNLQRVEMGLAPENVLTLNLMVSGAQRQIPGAAARYCYAIEERIRQIPGVQAAGFISFLPLQNSGWNGYFSIAGRAREAPARQPSAELRYVSPGYFRALGIPIRKGRGFTDRDNSDAPPVVLVNETLARLYFPDEDPTGQRILYRGTIIGVVGDVRQSGLDRAPAAEIYYPLAQNFGQLPAAGMAVAVRGLAPPESLASAVRGAIRDVNPNQPVFNIKTMHRVIADSLSKWKLYTWLIGLFAGIALLLAVAGIYGVISYAATSRTREFGIRLALGADARSVLGLVLRHGGLLVALGLIAGLCGALALTRLLSGLLYGVTPTDPATFAVMAVLLGAVALAACLGPARRAARVDPAVALRCE
jgi:putative ABC transport system permease protein